jgi:hypothetical protein
MRDSKPVDLAELLSLAIESGVVEVDGEARIGGVAVTSPRPPPPSPQEEDELLGAPGYPGARETRGEQVPL